MNCFISLCLFFSSLSAFATGTVSSVKGDVLVISNGESQSARRGLKVSVGDEIRTEKASFAKITMPDKNVFQIGPESAVVINQYETDGEPQDSIISVLYGRLRTTLEKTYDQEKSRFRLHTKSAIMGVRGTDFLTTYNKTTNQSTFVTFSGLIEVAGLDENGKPIGTRELGPGQMTLVNLGVSPFEPIKLPAQQLQNFRQSSETNEKHSMKNSASDDPNSGNQASLDLPSVDATKETFDDIVDKKLVGDAQGQFVRFIIIDDDEE